MFSPWARGVLAVFSLLFGLILVLWASGQGEILNYAPAIFCFFLFGSLALPEPASSWCGRVVALGVLSMVVFALIDGAKELSWIFILQAAGIIFVFGVPALMYLVRGRMPFDFRSSGGPVSVEFDEREIRCEWPNEGTFSMLWSELSNASLITTDEGPWMEDVYWHLQNETGEHMIVPQGALGHDEFLTELQQRLPGFENDAVIAAMGSTSNATFHVWSKGDIQSSRLKGTSN